MNTSMTTARILAQRSACLYHGSPTISGRLSLQLPILITPTQNPPRSRPATSIRKTYSTSTSPTTSTPAPQNEYLIVIPDHPNTSSARTKAKPGHIRSATPLIDAGIITYCGVTLSNAAKGKDQSISGSAIVMKAESEEEVREFLRQDEYTKFGVWDVKRAKIWGFRSG